ncbi:MAG: restriction endonuclease subunit S [Methylotenera sp.]
MSEWQEGTLTDIAEFVMGQSPEGETCNDAGAGVPLLNGPTEFGIRNPKAVQFTTDPKRFSKSGDILFCVRGSTTGKMNWSDQEYAIGRGLAALRHKNGAEYKYFLKAVIDFNLELLLASATGSTFPNVSKDQIANLEVSIPPLEEQKAIASVLSSLDDKIDLLHRQNTTLERMAETLFRQWFVEEAQEGWQGKSLSKIANFLNGLACQKFPPTDAINKLPVLKIKELSSGISENSDWATSNVKPEYIVENGDVIFAWSASLMVKVWDGEKCVLNQHLFKVTSQEFPKWFYLHWCKYHLDEFISISSSHATTMGHIKRGDLDTAMVKVPKPEQLALMSEQMTPLLEKQITNAKQIKTLEKLRDNLLSKLMSGEVRVS